MALPTAIRSLNLLWKRPEVPKFPTIWSTFSAKMKNRNRPEMFRIQDLPETRFDEGIDFLTKHFLSNEPLCQAFGLINDSQAIRDHQSIWRLEFKQKMATVCVKNDSNEIIAVNSTYIKLKDDHAITDLFKTFKSKIMLDYIEVFTTFGRDFNVFDHHGVDKIYTCDGLAINPNYFGIGITEQFIQSRYTICKEFGVTLTTAESTSDYSNRIGDKFGFKTDKELRYDDFRTLYPHVRLPHINSEAMKLRSMHIC